MARVSDFLNRPIAQGPRDEIGIGGWTLYARISDSYRLTADVPPAPLEDGSFATDHIILNPLVLKIEGEVGDLHLRRSPLIPEFVPVPATLGAITSFLPTRSPFAEARAAQLVDDARDALASLDRLLDAGNQPLRLLGNLDTGSKPLVEQFIDAMDALYYAKALFAVDMPFRRHENMTITDLTVTRDAQSNAMRFTMELSQFRFVETQQVAIEAVPARAPSAGTGGQTEPVADKGAQEGEPRETSLLTDILGVF